MIVIIIFVVCLSILIILAIAYSQENFHVIPPYTRFLFNNVPLYSKKNMSYDIRGDPLIIYPHWVPYWGSSSRILYPVNV